MQLAPGLDKALHDTSMSYEMSFKSKSNSVIENPRLCQMIVLAYQISWRGGHVAVSEKVIKCDEVCTACCVIDLKIYILIPHLSSHL